MVFILKIIRLFTALWPVCGLKLFPQKILPYSITKILLGQA